MAIDVEIDVEALKGEIKKTYGSVSENPEREFIFPTARARAEDLLAASAAQGVECLQRRGTCCGDLPSPELCFRPNVEDHDVSCR